MTIRFLQRLSATRRLLLTLGLLLPMAVAAPLALSADDAPGAAVKTTVEKILSILRKPDFKFEDRKSTRLNSSHT